MCVEKNAYILESLCVALHKATLDNILDIYKQLILTSPQGSYDIIFIVSLYYITRESTVAFVCIVSRTQHVLPVSLLPIFTQTFSSLSLCALHTFVVEQTSAKPPS